MALTQVTDIIVPEVFTGYVQQLTTEKSRLVQSGALSLSPLLNQFLAGGGLTTSMPSFRDLGNDTDNISTDDVSDTIAADFGAGTPATRLDAVPVKTQADLELAVRLSRNQAWSSADLAGDLAGADPMGSIASRVAAYWERKLQLVFVASWNGIVKDNDANDSGDYTNDISGGGFVDGVTNFSAEALIDATVTMGDSMDDTSMIMVHSIVYARMKKNNLIDFIPDSRGETNIATFEGRQVIVDNGMPNAANVYDTWLFGPGSTMLGTGSPKVPTATFREELAGNGGGQEVLISRVEWSQHPVGHSYTGTSPDGGPSNAATTNNLNIATSWSRVYPERNQIRFARLVTREA